MRSRLTSKITLLAGLMLMGFQSNAQSADILRDTALITPAQLNDLRVEFGSRKQYDLPLEKIVLYTLSYFPELKQSRIKFKVRNSGAPLSTRPAWGSVFRRASKRTYRVFIHGGPDSTTFYTIFQRASIPAQIGILGHELCHISNFNGKNTFGLLGIGASHLSKSYMDRFEFYTDSLCITKGLGYYLLEWAAMFDKMFLTAGVENPFKSKSTPTGERYMSAATVREYIRKTEGK